jgi:hypothetical protein
VTSDNQKTWFGVLEISIYLHHTAIKCRSHTVLTPGKLTGYKNVYLFKKKHLDRQKLK